MAINPKHTHTLYGVLSAKTKIYLIPLPWSSWFLFLFLLVQVGAWSPSSHVHLHLHGPITCPITWCVPTLLIWHSWQRLVLRFHQLGKTKLGLSISLFLVIDDNLFTKIFNKNFWIHVACLSILPCVKHMDKFHKPELVALAPPTYVLRVWIESFHICMD